MDIQVQKKKKGKKETWPVFSTAHKIQLKIKDRCKIWNRETPRRKYGENSSLTWVLVMIFRVSCRWFTLLWEAELCCFRLLQGVECVCSVCLLWEGDGSDTLHSSNCYQSQKISKLQWERGAEEPRRHNSRDSEPSPNRWRLQFPMAGPGGATTDSVLRNNQNAAEWPPYCLSTVIHFFCSRWNWFLCSWENTWL